MLTFRILDTDVIFEMTDDNEKKIKEQLLCLAPDTKILIVEVNEIVERQDLFY